MTASHRVSVIVTCRDLGEYLDEAIRSVREQTYRLHEIVVVDDGSSDARTLAVLDAVRAEGIQVLRTANRGLPAARNTGIGATSGALVCCLDADDRLRPTMLERSVAVLESRADIAFVSHWLETFGDESGTWCPDRCDFPELLDHNTVNGAAIVRRAALAAIGGYDEGFRDGCEDWDVWISLVERGFSGTILPEVLFEYRRRADSMSVAMARDVGHPLLYRRLVEKHADSYRRFLPELVLRRERDWMSSMVDLADHERDLERWLRPELAGLRHDVAMAEQRADRDGIPAQAARAEELQEALGALGQTLERERQTSAEAIERERRRADEAVECRRALEQEVRRLDALANHHAEAATALRESLTWRASAPARWLAGVLLRRGR